MSKFSASRQVRKSIIDTARIHAFVPTPQLCKYLTINARDRLKILRILQLACRGMRDILWTVGDEYTKANL